jgi:hypothetical protein
MFSKMSKEAEMKLYSWLDDVDHEIGIAQREDGPVDFGSFAVVLLDYPGGASLLTANRVIGDLFCKLAELVAYGHGLNDDVLADRLSVLEGLAVKALHQLE